MLLFSRGSPSERETKLFSNFSLFFWLLSWIKKKNKNKRGEVLRVKIINGAGQSSSWRISDLAREFWTKFKNGEVDIRVRLCARYVTMTWKRKKKLFLFTFYLETAGAVDFLHASTTEALPRFFFVFFSLHFNLLHHSTWWQSLTTARNALGSVSHVDIPNFFI